jgi:hypothetical protein
MIDNIVHLITSFHAWVQSEGPSTRTERLAGEHLRELIGPCPFCEKKLWRHHYAYLGGVGFNENDRRDDALWKALNEQRWSVVRSIGESDPVNVVTIAYALRCREAGRLGWFTVTDELDFLPVYLDKLETLNHTDSQTLDDGIPDDRWHEFF